MAIRVPSRTRQRLYGYVRLAPTPTPDPPSCPLPISPADAAVLDDTDSVTLTWASIDGAESYAIFLWESADAHPADPTYTSYSLSLDVTGLTANTSYSWAVCAVEDGLLSVGCGVRTFTTAEALPEAPSCPASLVSPNNGTSFNVDQSVTLTWTAGAGATSYNVYYDIGVEDIFFTSSDTLRGNTESLFWTINPQLVPGMQYNWRITSVNAGGESEGCTWNVFYTGLAPPGIECLDFAEGYAVDPKSVRYNFAVEGYDGNADIWFSTRDYRSEWGSGIGHAVEEFGSWGATTAATGCQATLQFPVRGDLSGSQVGLPADGSSYTLSFPPLTASSDFMFTQLIGFAEDEDPTKNLTLRIEIDGVEQESVTFNWIDSDAFAEPAPSNHPVRTIYFRVFHIRIKWLNGQSSPSYVIIESIDVSNVKDSQEP